MTLNSYFTLNYGWPFGEKFFARDRYFPAYLGVLAVICYSQYSQQPHPVINSFKLKVPQVDYRIL